MNDPILQLTILNEKSYFDPGDALRCEYLISGVDESQVTAVETSVLWKTEGKGDEDIGVHFFVRRTGAQLEREGINQLYRFKTTMPYSPLSYEGRMIKLNWCLRIRIFFRGGREFVEDRRIRLGNARLLQHESNVGESEDKKRWRVS